MANRWRRASLGEAGVSLIDCDHRTPPAVTTGYPYVAIPQLKGGRIELATARRISPEHFADWTRKAKPQGNDIVLSRRCNPGETAFVPPGLQFALGQNLVLLRSAGTHVLPEFLRWLVRGPDWWEQVQKYLNVGAVFDSLRCADVPSFLLPIPPLDEQAVIARVLGALDDKIELNRRTNETLEAMARALFKSWFVDFDPVRAKAEGRTPTGMDAQTAALFPTELVDSNLGLIPKGWRVARLEELTSKIGSGSTPRGGDKAYVRAGVSFIRSQNVYDSSFDWGGLVRINDEDARRLAGVTVELEDVLFNITGASFLRTCVVDPRVLPARVNQHVAIVRARDGIPPRYLANHLLQDRTKGYLLGMDAGASRQAVTKGHLESVPIVQPTDPVLRAWRHTVTPWYSRIDLLMAETRSLDMLRDELLPRLLSGALSVDALASVESH